MRKLNPGIKLLALIIASLLLSLTFNVRANVLIFAICLAVTLFSKGVNRKALFCGLVPFLLAAFGVFMSGYVFGAGSKEGVELSAFGQGEIYAGNLTIGLQLSSRILAYGGLGLMYALTSDAFTLVMSLMQQFRLPPKFAYGILAAYHFFPVVKEEYRIAGDALKVRGIKTGPFSTKRLFPMLVQAMERSESLAMAMESRGFQNEASRAIAFRTYVRWYDWAFLAGLNVFIAVLLLAL